MNIEPDADKELDADATERGGELDSIRPPIEEVTNGTRIDEAIDESFPASDPPSWTSGVEKDES